MIFNASWFDSPVVLHSLLILKISQELKIFKNTKKFIFSSLFFALSVPWYYCCQILFPFISNKLGVLLSQTRTFAKKSVTTCIWRWTAYLDRFLKMTNSISFSKSNILYSVFLNVDEISWWSGGQLIHIKKIQILKIAENDKMRTRDNILKI